MIRIASILSAVVVAVATAPRWQPQSVGTDANFRGLSAVNAKVAWVSGTKGIYARTVDGGENWIVATVPGAEKLDFRDVEAFGESTAYLMSAGPGGSSRIYKTTDGGKAWKLQFQASHPSTFLDSLAFWDEMHGIAVGDPVDGRFQFFVTDDGGGQWRPLPNCPAALDKEGAFAASGTCLITRGSNDAWFVTGGAKVARVLHSTDRGATWTATQTPLAAGVESAGQFSIAFRDHDHGMIVGGDYKKPNNRGANSAVTADGGKTWKPTTAPLPYQSAVAWAGDRWVMVGSSGSFWTTDNGATWHELDRENSNAIAFAAHGPGWRAGQKGAVARFVRP